MEFSKIEFKEAKIFYDDIFLGRQSAIALLKLAVQRCYDIGIFDLVHDPYKPDYMCLNYRGCYMALKYVVNRFNNFKI